MRHLTNPHYHLRRLPELGKLYWAHSVSYIGESLVTIFVPIYLFKLGHSIHEILLFYLLLGAFCLGSIALGLTVMHRIGANRILGIALLFGVAMLFMLDTLPSIGWPLWLVALTWAMVRGLYWPAFHANFSKSRAHKRADRQIATMFALVILFSGLAPAVGGVLASTVNIALVYSIAMVLEGIAAIPLFFGPEVVKHRPLALRRLNLRQVLPDIFANSCYSFVMQAELIIWPFFIFFLLPSYAAVGLLSSVAILSAIAISLYVGRRSASKGERHYLKEGNSIVTLSSAIRPIVQNTGHIFGINFVSGIGHSMLSTPYVARYYQHADEEPRLEYVFAMETAYILAWTFFYTILLGLSYLVPVKTVLLVGLLLAVPASFGIRKMR